MVNDEAFYKECLITFTTDPGFKKLGQAIQNKDAEAAFESAHALKGVAGNLGLDPLYQSLCDLVEALREEQMDKAFDAYSLFQNKLKDFRKTIEIIRQTSN